MDPELPRLVVRRSDDAATVWIPTDDERLRAELRLLQLLHRREERVEVEMGDDHVVAMSSTATNTA
jgi:hypothetical protein